ncbi:39644_t:CDS:2, partial [Gigaspora margarita]
SIKENEELVERFIRWNYDFMDNQLFIIRFCSDLPYKTHLLIQQAMQEASFNVFEVEVLRGLSHVDNDDNVDWILIEKYS